MSTTVPRDPLHKPHFGHKFIVNFTTMPTAYTMDTKKVRDRDRHRDGGSGRDRQNNGNKEGCVAAAAKVAAAAAAVTPVATHDDATFPMPQVKEVHDHNRDPIIARINDVDDSAT